MRFLWLENCCTHSFNHFPFKTCVTICLCYFTCMVCSVTSECVHTRTRLWLLASSVNMAGGGKAGSSGGVAVTSSASLLYHDVSAPPICHKWLRCAMVFLHSLIKALCRLSKTSTSALYSVSELHICKLDIAGRLARVCLPSSIWQKQVRCSLERLHLAPIYADGSKRKQ